MATQSAAPSNPTDDEPQNPASEIVQPTVEDQNDTEAGASGEISSTSMFVNSESMREEEEQNADSPQKVSNAQPAGTNQDGPVTSLSNVQPQVSTQIMQPSSAAPAGVSSTLKPSRFRWFYALLAAVGIIALCGLAVRFLALSAGTAILFKKAIVPWLTSWNRKVVEGKEEGSAKKTDSKPSSEQVEAAAAAKAAAAAAKAAEEAAKAAAAAAKAAAEVADMARGGQEMLLSKSEEKEYFKELTNLIGMQVNLIGMQVQEMKLMSNAIRTLEV
ncbi:peroxisomal membrane protein PEX14-like [Actinidia eriantha]|uniref:peroxisomal membrane protein PEX14-like n=1 Tax=Actinidia eriantha TaxID=165200 RepID=UPI002586289B|nr:peroxisomal membrane protein PEX14-like [Actinidia eriantha]